MSTKSVCGIELGAAHELWLALAKAGFTPALAQEVINSPSNQLAEQMLSVIQGGKQKRQTIDLDANPFTPDGWTVEEHQKGGHIGFDSSAVALWLSPNQQHSKYIEGHKLRQELANQLTLNANVLDFLLANPHLIPEDWKGKGVFFWGTVYRHRGGLPHVRCLHWGRDLWHWSGIWLDHSWGGDAPALVRASI